MTSIICVAMYYQAQLSAGRTAGGVLFGFFFTCVFIAVSIRPFLNLLYSSRGESEECVPPQNLVEKNADAEDHTQETSVQLGADSAEEDVGELRGRAPSAASGSCTPASPERGGVQAKVQQVGLPI